MSPLPLAATNFGFLYLTSREEAWRRIAEAGYELVELSACPPHVDLSELSPQDRRVLARELEGHGLRCTSINPVELNPISANAQLRAATAHQYRGAIELAADLGAANVVMITGRRSPLVPMPEAQAQRLLREHLESLLPPAQRLGVTLALEPVPYGFLQRAAEVGSFIRACGLDGLGITLDCANLLAVGADPAQEMRDSGDQVTLAHVSDGWRERWAHTQVGRGEIDFAAFAQALRDVAFAGPTVYELVDGDDPAPRFRADRAVLEGWGWA